MVLVSLEEADMVRAPKPTDMRVMRRRAAQRASAGPKQLSVGIVDVRSRIRVAVGRKEDVTRGQQVRPEDVEVYNGSVEIRALNDIRRVV